jgi:hypothetical protein
VHLRATFRFSSRLSRGPSFFSLSLARAKTERDPPPTGLINRIERISPMVDPSFRKGLLSSLVEAKRVRSSFITHSDVFFFFFFFPVPTLRDYTARSL